MVLRSLITRVMRVIESTHKLISWKIRTICNMQVLFHRDRGENSIGRITCQVALSLIFTKWANLKSGIDACKREWCYETDQRFLQHERAPCQLLSRFSPTNHRDCHFSEESLEKVTVLTFKRRVKRLYLVLQACSTRYWVAKQAGRRPPRGIAACISRLDWVFFLKWH